MTYTAAVPDRPRRRGRAVPEVAHLTLSSKHQVTLPVAMVRRLGLQAGDRLTARLEDGTIVLKPRPRSWVDYIGGSLPGYYGKTKEEIDAYLAEVREGWDRTLPWREESESERP